MKMNKMDKLVYITQKQHDQLIKKAVRNLRVYMKEGFTNKEAFLMVYDLAKEELEKNHAI